MTQSATVKPRHVAIIMDGNGRWARQHSLMRLLGHERGARNVNMVVEAAARRGIEFLTLFAFSSENWRRPEPEVSALMRLFIDSLKSKAAELKENNIKLLVAGDVSRFSQKLRDTIEEAQFTTLDCTGMTLQVCANYGGRWDIAQAARAMALKTAMGLMDPAQIDEEAFAPYLSVQQDVDLLIRTGGEKRISNFLLWQCAYSEIFFSDALWPDFDEAEFERALVFYAGRQRRFGKTPEQVENEADTD